MCRGSKNLLKPTFLIMKGSITVSFIVLCGPTYPLFTLNNSPLIIFSLKHNCSVGNKRHVWQLWQTHSYIILPVHPPEVNDGVWQRALGCNVRLRAIHSLKEEMV